MKKIKMSRGVTLTFEEGCNKYLENCRQRNLREGTIGHYRQSYTQFYKYFDPKMPVEDIDEQTYKDYVLHLKSMLDNDVSINSYLRDLITTFHFFMNEGWIPHFKMQAIKVDKSHIHRYRHTFARRWIINGGNVCPNPDCRNNEKETKELMGYIADHHGKLLKELTEEVSY